MDFFLGGWDGLEKKRKSVGWAIKLRKKMVEKNDIGIHVMVDKTPIPVLIKKMKSHRL